MKKLILILCLTIAFYSQAVLSQFINKSNENSDYWNMAFTGGALLSLVDRVEKDNKIFAGYNAGFEMFYDMKKGQTATVVIFNYGRIKKRSPDINPVYYKTYTEYFELTFGPRFYFAKRYFLEMLLGNYLVNYATNVPPPVGQEYHPGNLLEDANMFFGTGIGGGSRFNLSDDFDMIIKGKLNFLFSGPAKIAYTGLNTEIVFKNKKIEPDVDKRYAKKGLWSVTVYGGITNPELFHTAEYEIAGNIGIEGAYRNSPKFEIYGNLDYNRIKGIYSHNSGNAIVDLLFGPRFLIGSNKYFSFLELGSGIYMQDYQYDYYSDRSGPYIGINLGTGVIININEHVGIPIKGKMHLLFNDRNRPGGFLTAAGGLRYVL